MRINILFGFIFPWILGLVLLKKDKNHFLSLYPFIAVISNLICLWGQSKGYWNVKPKLSKRQYLTTLPFNFGLYPILGIFMVYIIRTVSKVNPYLLILLFSAITTINEFIYLLFGRVTYGNGWNINKTFLSYIVPYFLTYKYYLWFIK
ncbi:CBO0543 family protein [Peribacillus simplex]|uniref:CBO0543 family protein n=1 Tax=Peribacillus simplex TaxID=1478 RepID=UPI003D27C658